MKLTPFSATWRNDVVKAINGILASFGSAIHDAPSKTTPDNADEFVLADSADAWSLKKLTWANLKAAFTSTNSVWARQRFDAPTTADITTTLGGTHSIELRAAGAGVGAGAAALTFFRTSAFAVSFGLDIDNKLKIGGRNMGAVAYEIWNENNAASLFTNTVHGNRAGGALHALATGASAGFMSAADKSKIDNLDATIATALASQAAGSVGSYAFLERVPPATVASGGVTAGSNLQYSNAAATGAANPSGTWRCMGHSTIASELASTTLWLRIS